MLFIHKEGLRCPLLKQVSTAVRKDALERALEKNEWHSPCEEGQELSPGGGNSTPEYGRILSGTAQSWPLRFLMLL